MKDRKNIYSCAVCRGQIITVDRDEGTTPMRLACRAKADCPGWMISDFYQSNPEGEPDYEWFRPRSQKEVEEAINDIRVYFAASIGSNGLLLRKISKPVRSE